MSFRGGGTAGGCAPGRAAPEYIRQVPKFLQKYQHLLGRGDGSGGNSDTGQTINELQSERMRAQAAQDDFEDELQGATIVNDEGGLGLDGEDASVLLEDSGWLKDQGNAAFSRGEYEEAIKYFTKAIRSDPNSSVLYSNRSAAHAALKQYDVALQDGKKALQLQPRWPKAYSRIGAAYFGLEQYDEAIRAYEKGVSCDPKNAVCANGAKQARERMLRVDAKESQSGRHLFRKRKADSAKAECKEGLSKKQARPQDKRVNDRGVSSAGKTDMKSNKKTLLSFDDEEEI